VCTRLYLVSPHEELESEVLDVSRRHDLAADGLVVFQHFFLLNSHLFLFVVFTILRLPSYNASVVNFYNATGSPARFEKKYFIYFEKAVAY
jgi:hypothetical protein